jgi:hypothetical protein
MGQQNSKKSSNLVPTEKLFKLSYTVFNNKKIEKQVDVKEIDLSHLLINYNSNINVVMQFLYQKLKFNGYNDLNYINVDFGYLSIDTILTDINKLGFPISNNETIKDISFIKNCYKPSLKYIYHFLNKGSILLALIILDAPFIKECLKISSLENFKDFATDAVIIVGYNEHSFFIKTNWFEDTICVENCFIDNIKEIWDTELN